jgi:hypothetical protein
VNWWRGRPTWVKWLVTAGATCGAFVLQIVVPDLSDSIWLTVGDVSIPADRTWLVVGMFLTALAAGVPALEQNHAVKGALDARQDAAEARADAMEAADRAARERQKAVNMAVSPLASLLGQIADASAANKKSLRQSAVPVTLAGLRELVGGSAMSIRACFFRVNGSSPHRSLVQELGLGRGDQPSMVFTEGTARGDDALAALDARQARKWRADQDPPPPGGPGTGPYKAFISVPVATGERLLGMLTMDSTEADAFDEVDVEVVISFARLLGAALRG